MNDGITVGGHPRPAVGAGVDHGRLSRKNSVAGNVLGLIAEQHAEAHVHGKRFESAIPTTHYRRTTPHAHTRHKERPGTGHVWCGPPIKADGLVPCTQRENAHMRPCRRCALAEQHARRMG